MVQGTHENILQENIDTCTIIMAHKYEKACCVRGYHVYQHDWEAAVGVVLDFSTKAQTVQ